MEELVDEFVDCEGGQRIVRVCAWDDWPLVGLSIYGSAGSHWIGWWRRIRIALEVIIYGTAMVDNVWLQPAGAGTLATWFYRAAELARAQEQKEDK